MGEGYFSKLFNKKELRLSGEGASIGRARAGGVGKIALQGDLERSGPASGQELGDDVFVVVRSLFDVADFDVLIRLVA